jgi:CubicO group peptidase (beta-lactamase class C family)
VASACKPVFTHLLLAAVEQGRIASLDDPVVRHEPQLAALNALAGHKDRRITWRHLANQTSCYGVAELPGAAFDYSDYNMALLFDTLVVRVYGSSHARADETLLRPLLADPLGCEDRPTLMAFGTSNRPGRLAISPRDFCRFGLLYLHQGEWRGRRLVNAEHVRLVTTSPIANDVPRTAGRSADMLAGQRSLGGGNNQTDHLGSYSFAWWTNGVDRDRQRHWPDAPHDAYGAFGHGGKRAMVIIPSRRLVIAWNDTRIDGRKAENAALGLIARASE